MYLVEKLDNCEGLTIGMLLEIEKDLVQITKSLCEKFGDTFSSIKVHNLEHMVAVYLTLGLLKFNSAYIFEDFYQTLTKQFKAPNSTLSFLAKQLSKEKLSVWTDDEESKSKEKTKIEREFSLSLNIQNQPKRKSPTIDCDYGKTFKLYVVSHLGLSVNNILIKITNNYCFIFFI